MTLSGTVAEAIARVKRREAMLGCPPGRCHSGNGFSDPCKWYDVALAKCINPLNKVEQHNVIGLIRIALLQRPFMTQHIHMRRNFEQQWKPNDTAQSIWAVKNIYYSYAYDSPQSDSLTYWEQEWMETVSIERE